MRISEAFIEHVELTFPYDDKLADRLRVGGFDEKELKELTDFFEAAAAIAINKLETAPTNVVTTKQALEAVQRLKVCGEWFLLLEKDRYANRPMYGARVRA